MMNKRGISEMISYVLLIVIAVGLSVLIFAFLRLYVPKEKPECIDGINLVIAEAECADQKLKITIRNTGRFKINAAYIRMERAELNFREWLNDPNNNGIDETDFYFHNGEEPGLFPDESKNLLLPLPSRFSNGEFILEAQPAILTGRETVEELALCSPIAQKITCT